MKKFFSLFVSLLILGGLYYQIDIVSIAKVLLQSNTWWLTFGLGMLIPILMLTALRLVWIVPSNNQIPYSESLRLILSASAMNMLLPSKMGDVVKSVFMASKDGMSHVLSLSLVLIEKICDLLALLFWCLFGLLFFQGNHWLYWVLAFIIILGFVFGFAMLTSIHFTQRFFKILYLVLPSKLEKNIGQLEVGWKEMILYLSLNKGRFIGIMFFSIFLWLLHLWQIWLFMMALNEFVPFIDSLALTPLVILIGLLPLTFAGVGTRDAAFVFIYASYFTAETGAALGLLATMRYIIPALFGAYFFTKFVSPMIVKKIL